MKKCPRCKILLPENNFNWKIKYKRLQVYCKVCSRKYIREHYLKNTKYYLNKAKKRNIMISKMCFRHIGEYLNNHPCVDCGERDILVLEFDHRDKNEKDIEISRIIRNSPTLEKLKYEISKCDVRCANCHRRKTQRENNGWKLTFAPVA